MIEVRCELDYSRFLKAMDVAHEYSRRVPRKLALDTALYTAKKAIEETPFADKGRIDAEMGKMVSPSPRGVLPLSAAIVQASVWPGWRSLNKNPKPVTVKKYQILTNFRWVRPHSPFAGVKRGIGRTMMKAAVSRMLKRRRKSTHFLRAGWAMAIRKLVTFYGGMHPEAGLAGEMKPSTSAALGDAMISESGNTISVRVQNRIGMEAGKDGDLTRQHNEALHKYGGPALQRALDAQAREMVAHHWPKMSEEMRLAMAAAMA